MKKLFSIYFICSCWVCLYSQSSLQLPKNLKEDILSDSSYDYLQIKGEIIKEKRITSKSKTYDSTNYDGRRNQIKINAIPLAFGMPQISYDRLLKNNFSIGGSINFSIAKVVPFYFSLESEDLTFTSDEINSFGIMPEFKWYPPKFNDRKAPYGIYVGGTLRFQTIEYNSDVRYDEGEDSIPVDFAFSASLDSYSIGMEIGYQILFKNNMLLDFSFFRPRYVFNTLSFDSDTVLSDEILEALTQEVNDALGTNIFYEDLDTISLNEKYRFSNLGVGYAISIGYFF